MRSLLITVLAVSSLRASTADACGGYALAAPRVALVSTHWIDGDARSFVVIDTRAPADARWRVLVPRSFDHTKIAPAPPLEAPVTLTLVGPRGTRVVHSRSRHFLDGSFQVRGPATVLEVDAGDTRATIALVGHHAGARWLAPAFREATDADRSWVTAQGFPAEYVRVATLPGTSYQIITVHGRDGITLLRHGDRLVRQLQGQALGGIAVNGSRFVVVRRDRTARAARL